MPVQDAKFEAPKNMEGLRFQVLGSQGVLRGIRGLWGLGGLYFQDTQRYQVCGASGANLLSYNAKELGTQDFMVKNLWASSNS